MSPSYPPVNLDWPRQLLATAGSFWSRTFAAQDQLVNFVTSRSQLEGQTESDFSELVAGISRYTVPVYHRDNWYALRLRRSQRNSGTLGMHRYNEASLQFDGKVVFDQAPDSQVHVFAAPAGLVVAPLMANRITEPTLVLTGGVDYDLTDGEITFRQNPFDNPLFVKSPVFENGVVADEEIVAWLWKADFDHDTIYQQFGYVLGLQLDSSVGYRDLLNAMFDAIVGGTTRYDVERAFSAITDIPLVLGASEVVETTVLDNHGLLVMTDQQAYRYSASSLPSVAVGDTVHKGEVLADGLEIIEFNRGELPEDVLALAISQGLLAGCYYGDLVFENKEVDLVVDTAHSSGFTYVDFSIGGFPADVAAFFAELHARGVAAATATQDPCLDDRRTGTLAHLLDTRVNRLGEPTATDLPAKINPLIFLVENVLRHNAFLVRVKLAGLGPNRLGLYNMRQLARITPPHTAMLLLIELTLPTETIAGDNEDQVLGQFSAAEPLTETIPGTDFTHYSRSRLFSGTCQ